MHNYPCFFAEGRRFFYSIAFNQPAKNSIYVGSLDSKEKTRILDADSMAVLAGPDTFLFQRNGTLLAQKFDPEKPALIGEPVHIADNIAVPFSTWAAFGASNNGVLAY